MAHRTIRIGGASGYWGESDMAVPQFLKAQGLDYIVFDYLAEITMSIMARAKARSSELGYATDFVDDVIVPHLREIARQRVKIIANAGGMNPKACGLALEREIDAQGLDLKVAVVTGDNLIDRIDEFTSSPLTEMFTGETLPDEKELASANAYLGAFPIALALNKGADIVITGRCVDSAVSLGACIHEFGWDYSDLDQLSGASLAGHIIECGPQATGGNYTDWEDVADSLDRIGYPIAEVSSDGSFICTKPEGTGGAVTVGTVGEQMLYEIGDPSAYLLPDVVCDFSNVKLEQVAQDRVKVSGAKGRAAPSHYKVSATYQDGWRGGAIWFFYGSNASAKARSFAESVFKRARAKLLAENAPDFTEVSVELVGDESEFGEFAAPAKSRSVALKIAAKHEDKSAITMLLKETTGLGLAAPPGLSGFAGSRPKASPVLRLFSFLAPKEQIPSSILIDGVETISETNSDKRQTRDKFSSPEAPPLPAHSENELVPVTLEQIAYVRSGDKGDKANIGILPRRLELAPWIWAAFTEDEISARFRHYLRGRIDRFFMPGTGAMNIVLDEVLGGGGVASLRNDPQAKGYSQILLNAQVKIPRTLAEAL